MNNDYYFLIYQQDLPSEITQRRQNTQLPFRYKLGRYKRWI